MTIDKQCVRRLTLLILLGALPGLSSLAACGGSSAPGVQFITAQSTLQPTELWTIGTTPPGASASLENTWPVQVGDTDSNHELRALLKYSLTGLPAGALITKARLTIFWTASAGSPAPLGPILADHIIWPSGLISGADAYGNTLASMIGTFSFPTIMQLGVPGSAKIDVTTQVADDVVAGRLTTAFRLRAQTPSDGNLADDFFKLGGPFGTSGLFYEADLVVDYVSP